MRVLSACELVCIVYVSVYGCPLHCTSLSSILFFWEFSFDCDKSETKYTRLSFLTDNYNYINQLFLTSFIVLCLLFSLELVEA